MSVYPSTLKRVYFNRKDADIGAPPGLVLELGWSYREKGPVIIGLDDRHVTEERLRTVAAALSAAAGVDNHAVIGYQSVILEVDRRRFLTAITFTKTNKRVDFAYLFRTCHQAHDPATDDASC